MSLIDSLIQEGWLKTPRIIEAFRKIKRVDFLPKGLAETLSHLAPRSASPRKVMEDLAELNEALPIGFGQTISQPLTVAFMLEQLQPQPGEKILDIGSGSGWTSTLLGEIVRQQGKVIAIEVIPELMEFGKKNVEKYNFIKKGQVQFICADGSRGYQKEASFDKILVSATAERVFPTWKEQLKIGGRIVTPIGSSIWLFIKKSAPHHGHGGGEFEEIEYPGFTFVPLITKNP